MAHSLLDGADLRALRELSTDGAVSAVAAGLVDSGLLQFDPDDPEWDDRDRVVVTGTGVTEAVRARLVAAGADAATLTAAPSSGGDAMALAFGAAMAAAADGGAWRSWCVLDDAACDDGRVWEIARAAARAPAQQLGVLVAGGTTAALWRACGWGVHEAPAADPSWVLGALDQVVAAPPGVLLVSEPVAADE